MASTSTSDDTNTSDLESHLRTGHLTRATAFALVCVVPGVAGIPLGLLSFLPFAGPLQLTLFYSATLAASSIIGLALVEMSLRARPVAVAIAGVVASVLFFLLSIVVATEAPDQAARGGDEAPQARSSGEGPEVSTGIGASSADGRSLRLSSGERYNLDAIDGIGSETSDIDLEFTDAPFLAQPASSQKPSLRGVGYRIERNLNPNECSASTYYNVTSLNVADWSPTYTFCVRTSQGNYARVYVTALNLSKTGAYNLDVKVLLNNN